MVLVYKFKYIWRGVMDGVFHFCTRMCFSDFLLIIFVLVRKIIYWQRTSKNAYDKANIFLRNILLFIRFWRDLIAVIYVARPHWSSLIFFCARDCLRAKYLLYCQNNRRINQALLCIYRKHVGPWIPDFTNFIWEK